MKTPLHYQMTEYDCGPISMMNAIIFLFDREQIPPDLLRNIMLYCLDGYGAEGAPGRSGTTRAAMMFLSNFLGSFGRTGQLDLSARYLSGSCVRVSQNSAITDCLRRGGAVVVRLYLLDDPHYILLTGVQGEKLCAFDPYLPEEPRHPLLLLQPHRPHPIRPRRDRPPRSRAPVQHAHGADGGADRRICDLTTYEIQKKIRTWARCGSLLSCKLALCLHAGEAIAAVNRAIGLRLERNTRFAAAGSAGSGVILSRATGGVLAGVTAGLAALRLILEATLCVEFLLTGGENELFATFFADQRLVFVHFCYLSFAIKKWICPAIAARARML